MEDLNFFKSKTTIIKASKSMAKAAENGAAKDDEDRPSLSSYVPRILEVRIAEVSEGKTIAAVIYKRPQKCLTANNNNRIETGKTESAKSPVETPIPPETPAESSAENSTEGGDGNGDGVQESNAAAAEVAEKITKQCNAEEPSGSSHGHGDGDAAAATDTNLDGLLEGDYLNDGSTTVLPDGKLLRCMWMMPLFYIVDKPSKNGRSKNKNTNNDNDKGKDNDKENENGKENKNGKTNENDKENENDNDNDNEVVEPVQTTDACEQTDDNHTKDAAALDSDDDVYDEDYDDDDNIKEDDLDAAAFYQELVSDTESVEVDEEVDDDDADDKSDNYIDESCSSDFEEYYFTGAEEDEPELILDNKSPSEDDRAIGQSSQAVDVECKMLQGNEQHAEKLQCEDDKQQQQQPEELKPNELKAV